MKLPENRKERIKILALIGLGVGFVLYLLFVAVLSPAMKGKKERIEKIEQIRENLRKAEAKIGRMPGDTRSNVASLSELDRASSRDGVVLRDRLGNYLLSASEIVETLARDAGVEVVSVKENGISQIPQSSGSQAPRVLQAYTAAVQIQSGVHGLLRLLKQIESGNPYLCVSSLSIAAQPGKPESHVISFELQWPIWTDPKMPARLADQLRSMQEGGPAPAPAAAERKAP